MLRTLVFAFCLQGILGICQAQPIVEVEQVARQFLEAISKKDTTAFRALMIPEGAITSLVKRDGKHLYNVRGVEGDVRMLGKTERSFLERMWEPEIRVDGMLASVWTRYDFYVDQQFSHCGTDAFHVIQTEDGWKITSVIFTIEPDAAKCPQSPLGEPVFEE